MEGRIAGCESNSQQRSRGPIPYRTRQLTVHGCEGSVIGFEQVPGFRLHHTEQKSDMQMAVEFLRFGMVREPARAFAESSFTRFSSP